MTGGHAVSAVAHAVGDHRRARRPLVTVASVRAGARSLVLGAALSLVVVAVAAAAGRVARLTVAAARAVGEHSEHYREPGVERRFRVTARTVATCRKTETRFQFFFPFHTTGLGPLLLAYILRLDFGRRSTILRRNR